MNANIDLDNKEFKQVEALLAHTGSSVFMTGKAGTGKSTFLRYITSTTRKKHVVLAPTGIAAVNAGGQTLHSFFHIPLRPLLADDVEFSPSRLSHRMKYTARFVKMLRELELIIIDEISMVRADVIDFIDKILRHYCPKFRDFPFAGKQILMVGDVYQLEPVAGAGEREILRREYPNLYFFSARVFRHFNIVPVELRKVYRQTDSSFISLLDRVRAAGVSKADLDTINSRVTGDNEHAPDPGKMEMTIATRRDIVNHINETRLEAIKAPASRFTASVVGDFPETSFPTDRDLVLKEGAQVVFIRNDQERRWVNGTLGKVVKIAPDTLRVELDDGTRHDIEPEQWENIAYTYNEEKHTVEEEVKGVFRQYPVKLAWALTIHKSQGLTFRRVHIDFGNGAFAGGQSYVALSRCTSLEGLSLASPLRPSDIFVSSPVQEFARTFNDPRLVYGALESARIDALFIDSLKAFDSGDYTRAVEIFADACAGRAPRLTNSFRRLISGKLYALDSPRRENRRLREELARKQTQLDTLALEYVKLGDECADEGWDPLPAILNYDKALSLNPSCYEAKVGKARMLLLQGERDHAVDILLEAARATDRHEAQYELGIILTGEGNLPEALMWLGKACKNSPSEPVIYDALADVCEAMDNPAQAEVYRRQAARLRDKKRGGRRPNVKK